MPPMLNLSHITSSLQRLSLLNDKQAGMFIINLHAKFCHMHRSSVKVKIKFTLKHGVVAQRGGGSGIAILFL